jgi:hypothetical protein
MEVSLEVLKEKLGGDLSQRNVDRFLFQSLRRDQKPDSARYKYSTKNTGKENS